MERMLQFNPAKRITVEAALAHPYLAQLHNPASELSAPGALDPALSCGSFARGYRHVLGMECLGRTCALLHNPATDLSAPGARPCVSCCFHSSQRNAQRPILEGKKRGRATGVAPYRPCSLSAP